MTLAPALPLALQITLLGMGLVFAAILALWLLMAALVRLTAPRGEPTPAVQAQEQTSTAEAELAAQAAAAAVATALAAQLPAPSHFPLPPTALVSAWQAVRRAAQLNQRGPVR